MNRDLALIAANAGMLAVLAGALLAPLPIPEGHRVVAPLPQPKVQASQASTMPWPEVVATPRSLFRPIKPPDEAPALPSLPSPAPPPTPSEPALTLRGILSDGPRWLALIEIEGEPERRLVGRGDRVGAWVVSGIEARSITLGRQGEQRELPLDPPL